MGLRILVTEPIPGNATSYLRSKGFDVIEGHRNQFNSEDKLIEGLTDVDALLSMLSNPVSRRVLEACPTLKIVANYAVGYNNIDIEAAAELGIRVANTPDVLSEATADIALLLLLATARKVLEAEKELRSGLFDGWHPKGFLGFDLYGKTAGIIGMGRIGRAIAKRLHGFSVNITYHNRSRLSEEIESETNATYYSNPDTMLGECDFVFLSCPLTPQTRHIIDEKRLSLLPPNCIIINTGRGPLIDEASLAKALHQGRIAGAGLDVFEHEPEIHPDLLSAPNTVLLPHIGSATHETREAMGMMAARAIEAVLNKEDIRDFANIVV